jgi:hypothetical protein
MACHDSIRALQGTSPFLQAKKVNFIRFNHPDPPGVQGFSLAVTFSASTATVGGKTRRCVCFLVLFANIHRT